jgi:TRAP-type C4-dicarboxylate transport system permease large subunit
MAAHAGVGPVQFVILIFLNRALGLVHPPIDSVQVIDCAIANVSIGEITKVAWPYYLAIFSAITIVTYVPMFFDVIAEPDQWPPNVWNTLLKVYAGEALPGIKNKFFTEEQK